MFADDPIKHVQEKNDLLTLSLSFFLSLRAVVVAKLVERLLPIPEF